MTTSIGQVENFQIPPREPASSNHTFRHSSSACRGDGRSAVEGESVSLREYPGGERKLFRKKAIPNATRVAVAERHGCAPGQSIRIKCAYCDFVGLLNWWPNSRWVQSSDLEFDHVIPEFKGGDGSPENIVLACRPCNRRKGWRRDG